ncbi:DUF4157 domain-containing protein [Streptomyces tanashiensis]|uniref:eCIS core domain-containing protein n=1 Tax=Streptomyces tanashiensis TaxID=67367 RepID=UPI003682E1DA
MRDHDKVPRTHGPAPARTPTPPTPAAGLLALQNSAGNAAVVQMLREADHAWTQDAHHHGPGCGHQRTDQPAPAVQRSAVPDVLRASGKPLDPATQADMGARLGADFSEVRVHTDAAARASAASLGARAYTSGNHIVIGEGGGDRHTLAHELTHVIQQRRGPVSGTDHGDGLSVSDPSDRFEREAEASATRALAGRAPEPARQDVQRAPATGSSRVAIQRVTQGHKQGEHIFNALDDLTQKCSRILLELLDEQIKLLQTNKAPTGSPAYKALWEAQAQAEVLSDYAGTTGRDRNNDAFKTASRGAPLNDQGQDQNSIDYSALSNRAKDAMALCGTTGWAAALAGLRTIEGTLPGAITDQVAHDVKRDEDLRTTDRPAFDTWFTTTGAALKGVFTALILTGTLTDAALRNSDRAALGYEPGDEVPAFRKRARAGQAAEYA